MRREFDMKRLLRWLLVGAVLTVLLWGLLDIWQIALFVLAAFGLSALMMNLRIRSAEKKKEAAEQAEEDAQKLLRTKREEACRQARYTPEERRRIEQHMIEVFDPLACWNHEPHPVKMAIDIALIPPTEVSPYWRAVTCGAGANVIWNGPLRTRAEFALLLPPDWHPSDPWPFQFLRDAAWSLIAEKGIVGHGAVFRGFSAMSAGFAGAVLLNDLWNQYPLEAAELPNGEHVAFYWLFPLLKTEWDYYLTLRRSLRPLEERLAKADPAADPKRPSVVDPLTWFQEDIDPFVWSQEGDQFCLGLDTEHWRREIFLQANLSGTGWDWERLAREYLRHFLPEDAPFIEYACDEWTFFAVSEDREILQKLALGLRDLCGRYPKQAARLLIPDKAVKK